MKKSKAICFDYLRTYIQRYDGETNTVIEELGDLEECLQRISKMDSVDRTLKNSAKYIFKDSKVILHDKRIRECNYGDLNGEDTSLVKYEEHIDSKFPNGESLKEVEKRLRNFCDYLLENYNGKTVALVAHKAPQLALEVITKNISWKEAIDIDWRKTKNWQPGWRYEI